MFVRFRAKQRQLQCRLQCSLIETRRVGGKVRHEHIAQLGSVAAGPSVADRVVVLLLVRLPFILLAVVVWAAVLWVEARREMRDGQPGG